MKSIKYLIMGVALLSFTAGCKNVNYKKTKSGLLYKIFPGNGKDSLIKAGAVLKIRLENKYDDSVMYDNHDKIPYFMQVRELEKPSYDFQEILPMMREGDSAVVVQITDTLLVRQPQMAQSIKPGGRVIFSFKINKVFWVDSIARADYQKEMEKDKPRQMKEQAEQQMKQQSAEIEKLEKSGEAAKEIKEMEAYLKAKGINAQKTGKGTYVYIQQQGSGPAAENEKYVKVQYSGRVLATDSAFQTGTYPFQLGVAGVIRGWDEGLLLFKKGGKGTLYIPGFLAYGENPGPGGQPYEALIFDVELLDVSDKPIE